MSSYDDRTPKTKQEILKDYLTALEGIRVLLHDMRKKCEATFGQDFGLHGVEVGILLAHNYMAIFEERIR